MRRLLKRAVSAGVLYPQLVAGAALAEVALRRAPLPRVVNWARRVGRLPLPVGRGLVDDARLERMAARAVALVHGPDGCLRQTVLLAAMGHDAARAAEVVVGVDRRDGLLASHAWLEKAGRPVADSAARVALYAPLARF